MVAHECATLSQTTSRKPFSPAIFVVLIPEPLNERVIYERSGGGVPWGGGGSPEVPEWGIKGRTWQRRYPVNDP